MKIYQNSLDLHTKHCTRVSVFYSNENVNVAREVSSVKKTSRRFFHLPALGVGCRRESGIYFHCITWFFIFTFQFKQFIRVTQHRTCRLSTTAIVVSSCSKVHMCRRFCDWRWRWDYWWIISLVFLWSHLTRIAGLSVHQEVIILTKSYILINSLRVGKIDRRTTDISGILEL